MLFVLLLLIVHVICGVWLIVTVICCVLVITTVIRCVSLVDYDHFCCALFC